MSLPTPLKTFILLKSLHNAIKIAQQYAGMPTEANKKAVNDVFECLNELEKQD